MRTSTTTTTSFLGKVQWTGEIHYNLPFLLEPFLFQRLPVPQPPIGEGLCQPDPPCLESTLLINHMIIVVVLMTIILLMIFMRTSTSLIYCLTVSSVFWPDIDSIIFSAASSSNTFVLAPICSKSYSIEWLNINLLPCRCEGSSLIDRMFPKCWHWHKRGPLCQCL